jgi:hypothetical protein
MLFLRKLLAFCLLGIAVSGCATYTLTPQSLVEQAARSFPEKKRLVFMAMPLFIVGTVNGNSLEYIECQDKDGEVEHIRITQRTGVRITKKDNTRKTFYFDTLILKDSLIIGSMTHFGNVPVKPIKLIDIAKIEIMK